MLNHNYYLVPSPCAEYLIYPDHYFWAADLKYSENTGISRYGAIQLIPIIGGLNCLTEALKKLEEQILPQHNDEDDIYEYIRDYIDQILYLAVQISEDCFNKTCKTLNRIVQQEDPQNPGFTYREIFNRDNPEEEDLWVLPDYTKEEAEGFIYELGIFQSTLESEGYYPE